MNGLKSISKSRRALLPYGAAVLQQIIEAAESQGATIGAQGQKGESLTVWINALIESAGGHVLENPEAPAGNVTEITRD